jgi:glycosyltransferase involved in cell wall biosynthesis
VSSSDARDSRVRRLLFVGTNRGPGGTESHFVSLAVAMADAGYEVAAAVYPDDVIARSLAVDGRIAIFPAAIVGSSRRKALSDLSHACRSTRPDWIIGTFAPEYWALALLSRTQRIPLALFLHIQKLSRLTAPLFPWLASRFILPSAYLRNWAVKQRGMPLRRTYVLYNPIDVERFRPDAARRAAARRQFGFTPDDVVIGFAGRFERQKGVTVLASALDEVMARLPAVRALWVGHGELAAEMEAGRAASPRAARHVCVPWTDDIATCFAAMDVLAFPSIRRESFGRVAAEAQACGVAVVASNDGGIPETIRDGESGILVPPGDVPAWADAITRLASDASLRARMGAAGRAQACERFAAPRIAEAFGRLLGN